MPEAAAQSTRPAPAREAAGARRARLPEGAFSIIPTALVDRDGRADIGDVCDTLALVASVLAGNLERCSVDDAIDGDEREGLVLLARFVHASYADLDALFAGHMADLADEVARGRDDVHKLERRMAIKDMKIAELEGLVALSGRAAAGAPALSPAPAVPAGPTAPDLTEPTPARAARS